MGKRRSETQAPAVPAPFTTSWLALWALALACLAFLPDEKLVRLKLLALEGGVWALVAALAAAQASGRLGERVATPLDGALFAYAASGLVFFALSPERGVSLPELTRTLFSAAVFFAASQTLPRLPPRPLARAWAWTAGLVGLYALLQTRGGIGPIAVHADPRPFATFGNPIFLAAYLAASACVAAGLAAAESGALRAAALAASGFCLAGLWVAQSRAALAGLAAAAALWLGRLAPGNIRAAGAATLAAGGVLGALWFKDRAFTHGLIWKDTVALWLEHPWLGCGLGRYHVEFPAFASAELQRLWPQGRVIVNFAHNEYLQVLAETGVLGLAALLAVPAAFARWAWRDWPGVQDRERAVLTAGFGAAATALWVQALASPDLRFGVSAFVAFLAMGAAVAWSASRAEPASPRWRAAVPALSLLFLAGWGRAAVEPFLAQRRLRREPAFHVDASPEVREQVRLLEELLAKDPSNADVAENLGYLYARERAWDAAIARYALVTTLAPSRPGPYNNLGNLYYSTGDLPKAIEQWKRSVELKPDQLDAHLNLGKALYEVGRLKESAAHLEAALRLDPKNEKARVLLRKMVE